MSGCNGSCTMRGYVLRGYRRRRGLGQDDGDFTDSFSGGGDAISPGLDQTANQIYSPGLTTADFAAIDAGTYIPPADTQFSTPTTLPAVEQSPNVFTDTSVGPGGVPVYNMPDGSQIDAYGTTYFPDGSQISALGTFTDANGNTTFTDGSQVLADGTYIDPQGNVWPPNSPQAQQAQQKAAATGGGSAGGGGGAKGGGGSQKQSPLQQAICLLNPSAAGCPGATQTAAQRAAAASSSGSFSSFMSKNWQWFAIAAGVLLAAQLVADAVAPSGRR
jgi:hypothetical protein